MNECETIPSYGKETPDSMKETHVWKEIVLQNVNDLERKSQNVQNSYMEPYRGSNLSASKQRVPHIRKNVHQKAKEEHSIERSYSIFGCRLDINEFYTLETKL